MKTFIVLTVFAITVSCIKGSYTTPNTQSKSYSELAKQVGRYCDLPEESRKMFRFCLQENGVISVELFRNCAQQLKFAHTFEELSKFVCQPGTKLQSLFMKCFIPAYSALLQGNPKEFPVVEKCLSYEENNGFHAEDHIKEEYHW